MLKTADRSSNPLCLILFAVESSFLYMEEAKLLLKSIQSKVEDCIPSFGTILKRMIIDEDARRLLRNFIGGDVMRMRRLKQSLGAYLGPLIGIYSGFYSLDLYNPIDRLCMKRLIEKSVSNCNVRWNNKLGDTSQNGNWSCFRNEYHPDNPERKIHPKYFCPIPKRSRVEFDFINIARPDRGICKAVEDDVVIDVSDRHDDEDVMMMVMMTMNVVMMMMMMDVVVVVMIMMTMLIMVVRVMTLMIMIKVL